MLRPDLLGHAVRSLATILYVGYCYEYVFEYTQTHTIHKEVHTPRSHARRGECLFVRVNPVPHAAAAAAAPVCPSREREREKERAAECQRLYLPGHDVNALAGAHRRRRVVVAGRCL